MARKRVINERRYIVHWYRNGFCYRTTMDCPKDYVEESSSIKKEIAKFVTRKINNKVMKSILILLIGLIIMSPCLLMLNDSGNILPNIIGFVYTLVLCVLGSKQWAKHLFIKFLRAFKTL